MAEAYTNDDAIKAVVAEKLDTETAAHLTVSLSVIGVELTEQQKAMLYYGGPAAVSVELPDWHEALAGLADMQTAGNLLCCLLDIGVEVDETIFKRQKENDPAFMLYDRFEMELGRDDGITLAQQLRGMRASSCWRMEYGGTVAAAELYHAGYFHDDRLPELKDTLDDLVQNDGGAIWSRLYECVLKRLNEA